MADRVEYFECVIPPGTPIANPVTIDMPFDQGNVTEIDIRIPNGPAGNVGFQVAAGGTQYVPRTPNTFIVDDDNYLRYPQASAIVSGDFSLIAYNTGTYPHTIYVAFQINELALSQAGSAYTPGASSDLISSAIASF